MDEVGRGCLAGPVFAAAVALKQEACWPDSKTLPPHQREKVARDIKSTCLFYGLGVASVEEIDRLNILQSSLLAMRRAVHNLPCSSGHVLVDGLFQIPDLSAGFCQTCFVKGDRLMSPIGAASTLAKVERDQWMRDQDQKFPGYEFSSHKGYGTPRHKSLIAQRGPSPLHRRHFRGVKEYWT